MNMNGNGFEKEPFVLTLNRTAVQMILNKHVFQMDKHKKLFVLLLCRFGKPRGKEALKAFQTVYLIIKTSQLAMH